MKKIKYLIIMSLLAFSFNSYAEIQEDILEDDLVIEEVVNLEFSEENVDFDGEMMITSTGEDIDIENFYRDVVLNSTYIYYYGQGCAYCANLDRYLNSVNGFEKLNIEKREIYRNPENSKSMMEDAERLGLDVASVGVPFLIVNTGEEEIPMIGDRPIIDFFTPVLGETPENKNKAIVLAILAVLAILLPVFLIKLSNKN